MNRRVPWRRTKRGSSIGKWRLVKVSSPASGPPSAAMCSVTFSSGASIANAIGPTVRLSRSPPERRLARRLCCTPSTRSEEHTSELQSLMLTAYAVFLLKKKKIGPERAIHHIGGPSQNEEDEDNHINYGCAHISDKQ